MENEENVVETGMVEVKENSVHTFDELRSNSNTDVQIYTNITDKKKMFNLENHVDYLLNDCEGEYIRVKGVLVKVFKKPLKEPVVDETTGEIIKEFETSMSCILIDDNGKSYATGSKIFAISLMRYIQQYDGINQINAEGLEIKITKVKTGDKGNKALSFELV